MAEETAPQRIVSLSPVITEELFLLGEEGRLVGRSRYCTKPAGAEKIEVAGNIIEVSVEKITALHPDQVLATAMMDPKAKVKLESLGISVVEFPAANDFSGMCEAFLRLSRIVGREKKAKELIHRATQQVDELRRQVGQGTRPSVFLQLGAEPIVTVTKESFLNDLIESAGGVNIARGVGRPLYSREKVLADNPDVIMIVSMGYDGKKEKQVWEGYRDLEAARQHRIYIVDSDLFCAPTPLSYVTALGEMKRILESKGG